MHQYEKSTILRTKKKLQNYLLKIIVSIFSLNFDKILSREDSHMKSEPHMKLF